MVVVRFELFLCHARDGAVDSGIQNPALSFRVVPVDQSLKARIASKRIPDRIELQKRNRDSSGRTKRMLEELKRLIGFTRPRVNFGELKRSFWSFESILRFGH